MQVKSYRTQRALGPILFRLSLKGSEHCFEDVSFFQLEQIYPLQFFNLIMTERTTNHIDWDLPTRANSRAPSFDSRNDIHEDRTAYNSRAPSLKSQRSVDNLSIKKGVHEATETRENDEDDDQKLIEDSTDQVNYLPTRQVSCKVKETFRDRFQILKPLLKLGEVAFIDLERIEALSHSSLTVSSL